MAVRRSMSRPLVSSPSADVMKREADENRSFFNSSCENVIDRGAERLGRVHWHLDI